jgi:hypothetical protein
MERALASTRQYPEHGHFSSGVPDPASAGRRLGLGRDSHQLELFGRQFDQFDQRRRCRFGFARSHDGLVAVEQVNDAG